MRKKYKASASASNNEKLPICGIYSPRFQSHNNLAVENPKDVPIVADKPCQQQRLSR
jgi:hypothetical protein